MFSNKDVIAENVQFGALLLPFPLFSHRHWDQIMPKINKYILNNFYSFKEDFKYFLMPFSVDSSTNVEASSK